MTRRRASMVTGYFRLHPEFVRMVRAKPYAPAGQRKSGRLTVDTPDDLAFVEAVHARLAAKAGEASLADLLLLLEREPEMKALPAPEKPGVARSSGEHASERLALIRCDGGGKFGYGHVKRMVGAGARLARPQGFGVIFALNGSEDARQPIRRAGFDVTMLEHAFPSREPGAGEQAGVAGPGWPRRSQPRRTGRVEAPCRRDRGDRRRP